MEIKMKVSQFSDYEKYILLADKCKLPMGYESFLRYKEVISFVKDMVGKQNDTFMHNGTIYSKKISTSDANSLVDSLEKRRVNVFYLKLVANQLKIRI
tara:strand:+ start:66 stop:359 length:294 start_codon:yes stop_codon:yes gene_type:complete